MMAAAAPAGSRGDGQRHPAGVQLRQVRRRRDRELTSKLADQIGLPAARSSSSTSTSRRPPSACAPIALDPIVLHVESGALEDPSAPRRSRPAVADVLGRLLLRVKDRPTAASPMRRPTPTLPCPAGGLGHVLDAVGSSGSATTSAPSAGSTTSATGTASPTSPTPPSKRLWAADPDMGDIEAVCAETASAAPPSEARPA